MDPTLIAAILGAGGLTVLVPQLITGIRGMIDGHHAQEKAENVDALAQRDKAIRERDRADRCRRVFEDYASRVRRIVIEHGLGHLLPPWPGEPGDRPPAEPPGDGQPGDDPTH